MRTGLIFASALTLAACSTAPQPVQIPTPVVVAPVEVEAPAPSPKPEQPALPEADFSLIEGQTPAAVQNYLGHPSLVRRDENVQIMIFETESCVFQVTFYEPSNGEHFRAEHMDTRTRKGDAYDPQSCVLQLLNAQE